MGYSQQLTVTLATTVAASEAIPIGGATGGKLQIPSTANLDLLEYYGSEDGTTYSILEDAIPNPVQTGLTASEARSKKIPDECFPGAFLKIKAAAEVEVVVTLHFE